MTVDTPLTPADCDLRDFRYMPLYGERLFNSETWLLCDEAEKVAALRLWWRSWHEVPAASLPDNDRLLAEYAGYGVAISAWKKVRETAMRGWILCSDGRLYHPVVAEIANQSWAEKQKHSTRKEKDRKRKSGGTTGDDPPVSTGNVTPFQRNDDGNPSENPLKGEGREREKEGKEEGSHTGRGRADEDFERFWAAYPCRPDSSPVRAREAWDATAAARPPLEDLLAAITAYERYVQAENDKRRRGAPLVFCHPHIWLSDQRWAGSAKPKPNEIAPKARDIPPGWLPIAEAFAKARSAWAIWDAVMLGCEISDGPALGIAFRASMHRQLADDNGTLGLIERIAEGLGLDVVVSTKPRAAA